MKDILLLCNNEERSIWDIEYTDEFGEWWNILSLEEQISVTATVELLEQLGPNLRFPHSSGINGSNYSNMRELRVQHNGEPFRILYAFDPRRIAILLIGGNKNGKDRWYKKFIHIADKLYSKHLNNLKITRKKHGKKI